MKNISPLTESEISSALQELQGWNYDGSSHISARFKFKNYAEACAFVTLMCVSVGVMLNFP